MSKTNLKLLLISMGISLLIIAGTVVCTIGILALLLLCIWLGGVAGFLVFFAIAGFGLLTAIIYGVKKDEQYNNPYTGPF